MQRDLDGYGLEFRTLGSFFKQSVRDQEFQIDELSTVVADRMVVPLQLAVVAGAVGSESDFADQPLFFQVAQRIVNSRERDARQ